MARKKKNKDAAASEPAVQATPEVQIAATAGTPKKKPTGSGATSLPRPDRRMPV